MLIRIRIWSRLIALPQWYHSKVPDFWLYWLHWKFMEKITNICLLLKLWVPNPRWHEVNGVIISLVLIKNKRKMRTGMKLNVPIWFPCKELPLTVISCYTRKMSYSGHDGISINVFFDGQNSPVSVPTIF